MTAVKVLPDENICNPAHPLDSFPYKNKQLDAIYSWSGKSNKDTLKDFIYFCIDGEFDIR